MRPGYKQTDVGVIPEDWEVKSIGDLASVSAGGTPSRKIPEYWNGSIPWITTSQIDFGMIAEADQFITENGLHNSATKLLPAGTLLMALYGQGKTRGKVGVLGFEAATNQACASISLHGDISREFLLHFLISRYEIIRNSSNSGSQENLNGQIVKDISISIPPTKAEQEAIAGALSDADGLIESLEQLIAKKRQIKQGAMQELLTGKKRLPGFSGEWEVTQLGDLATTIASGKSKAISAYCTYDVHGSTGIIGYSNNADYEGDAILVARVGANAGKLNCVTGKYGVTDNTIIVKLVSDYCLGFYYRQLEIKNLNNLVFGSGQPLITGTQLKSILLPVPSPAEQTAIATILSAMDAEITTLETRLAKTRSLKQGMMHNLLTGRIRLL